MEKYIQFSLIALFLISSFKYTNTEECTKSGISETDCKANKTCQWTATGTCAGADACKSKTEETACTDTSTGCKYTAAGTDPTTNPATCLAGSTPCANGFTDADTCQKCQFTATGGACSVKSSSSNNDSGKSSNSDSNGDEDFSSCLKFSGLIGLLSLLF